MGGIESLLPKVWEPLLCQILMNNFVHCNNELWRITHTKYLVTINKAVVNDWTQNCTEWDAWVCISVSLISGWTLKKYIVFFWPSNHLHLSCLIITCYLFKDWSRLRRKSFSTCDWVRHRNQRGKIRDEKQRSATQLNSLNATSILNPLAWQYNRKKKTTAMLKILIANIYIHHQNID